MNESEIFYQDEVQLLGFGESDSYGAWFKVRLRDPDHIAKFRGHDSGKKNGKRFACVLVEIDDNELPKKQSRQLSQDAFLMCQNENFHTFLIENFYIDECDDLPKAADVFLKQYLNISSKSEIDKSEEVQEQFKKLQKSYSEFVRKL